MDNVSQLIEALKRFDPDTPIVIYDTRSGVPESITGLGPYTWADKDNDYGVELPVGTPVARLYVG